MTTHTPKPYDRQPNETDKSWAAFCMYRDMGRERSTDKVRKQIGYTSSRVLQTWSSKHAWVKRCSAFDDDELERESVALQNLRLERRLQMEKDAWNRREKLIKKADMIARIPLVKPETSEDGTQIFMPTDKWSLKDAIAFYQYSDNLGIFATGGETKPMTEIEAINTLVNLEVLPAEFAVIAAKGVEQFKNLLRDLLKNATSDNRQQPEQQTEETEPIGAFSDILESGENQTTSTSANDSQ